MKYTGRKNEKATAWAEEERPNVNSLPRGCGEIGSEGQSARSQQERAGRAISERSSVFSCGTAVTGGMLDHLIDDCRIQVARKKEEKQQIENEIERLESKISEIEELKQELSKKLEASV
ncbi:hypothetical protein Cal7507_1141 [Calothrix sp. PCC 7507]|nr:hypothetical protein [Calothrix sp. PCC 7507]AFY31615.1 hypothetical protein Cal7507_1141 [Calothrix sp. PCC 7507]